MEVHVAAQFLSAIFSPGDTVLFRPIETWTEGNKKIARVDYPGVAYHTLGLRLGKGKHAPLPARDELFLSRTIARSAAEKSNVFYGVCPRFAPGDDYSGTSFDLAWQIRTVRCLWADVDNCSPDDAANRCNTAGLPSPSIIVASGHGTHPYWLLDSPVLVDDQPPPPVYTEFTDQGDGKKKRRRLYLLSAKGEREYLDVPTHRPELSPLAQRIQDTLSGIAQAIGGDHTTDLSRILRVPGTLNRKNERNGKPPVPCELILCEPSRRYPLSCFDRFWQSSPQRLDRERISKVPLPRTKTIGAKGQARLDSLIADCIAADTGTRSEADFALCCWAVERGYPKEKVWESVANAGKFSEAGDKYFERTWDAAENHTREKIYTTARTKAEKKSAKQKQREHEEGKDGLDHEVKSDAATEVPEATDDPHRLARLNLERYATRTDGRTLRYWRSEWYTWKKGRYQRITTDEFRAKLSFSIREEFERLARERQDAPGSANRDDPDKESLVQKVTAALVNNVMLATSGMPAVCVSSQTELGTWLPDKQRKNWMAMANGIVDIDAVLADRDEVLRPHSPEWFATVCLPYAFDQDAKCPKFEGFLEHNLELDAERIKILQEWAGYLLLPDTGEQQFMLLEGEGANGKSVFVAALTAMLGPENVSNVPLEKFGDRFSLSTTMGKLLNAAADCGEIDKSAEGDLKSFVSGDRMMFDRKGLPPVECAPTARLMIACNNHPRVSDRSQGVWRRMLLIPWQVQVAKEMRIRGMDKVEWWQNSGELPGILNWAIVGLDRLRKQRGFTESVLMQEAIQDYREEMNPARVFLQEHCETSPSTCVRSTILYRFYRKWAEENGYHPLSNRVFGREVKRVFPEACRKHKSDGGSRIWVMHGLKFSQDEICGERTEEYALF